MERTRIVIVEDEPVIATDLAAMLQELGHVVCGKAYDAAMALELIEATAPDLVLLDIRLNNGPDGIVVAGSLKNKGIPFMYVTSHADPATMERVAVTQPQGFIIKPFDKDDLRTQIMLALARIRNMEGPDPTNNGPSMLVRDKGRSVRVWANEIIHAQADDKYTILHTASRRYTAISSLSAIEEELNSSNLMRIHRKHLVDLRKVTATEHDAVYIGELRLPVGRTRRRELRERMEAMHGTETNQ